MSFIKKLLSKSKILNALLGDVIFSTPPEHGAYAGSSFEWRVKRSVDNTRTYIAVKIRSDGAAGTRGSMTNYINFDLEAAIRLRDNLNDCIEFVRRQPGPPGKP